MIRDWTGILWKNDGEWGNWYQHHTQNGGFWGFGRDKIAPIMKVLFGALYQK
jgi:hypothetical protein